MATSARSSFWNSLSITVGLLFLVGAGAVLLAPREHKAFALVKVSATPPTVLSREAAAADEFSIFKRTQAQLVLSNLVLTGVLRDASIARLNTINEHRDDSVRWLRDHLAVDFPDDAEIMRISMTGPYVEDLTKILDKAVAVYIREIVERERDMRLEREQKLQNALTLMKSEVQKKQEALRALEALHKTNGSEAAKLKKQMAIQELNQMIALRSRIRDQLDDNTLEIMLEKTRREFSSETRTADVLPAANDGQPDRSTPLELVLLKKERDYLEARLRDTDEAIGKQINVVESLESFSVQVAAQQDDLHAQRDMTANLQSELDRMHIERLAPSRIVRIDNAAPANGSHGDALRRYAAVAVAAIVGLALVGVGIASRRPAES